MPSYVLVSRWRTAAIRQRLTNGAHLTTGIQRDGSLQHSPGPECAARKRMNTISQALNLMAICLQQSVEPALMHRHLCASMRAHQLRQSANRESLSVSPLQVYSSTRCLPTIKIRMHSKKTDSSDSSDNPGAGFDGGAVRNLCGL